MNIGRDYMRREYCTCIHSRDEVILTSRMYSRVNILDSILYKGYKGYREK